MKSSFGLYFLRHVATTRHFTAICPAILSILLLCKPCHCAFESYHVLGAGAVSNALGGSAAGCGYDTFEYLVNPALIRAVYSTRYSLALANMSGGHEYKYTIFSYARRNKGLSLIIDDEDGTSRDMVTYSAVLPYGNNNNYIMGFNASAFRFSTPTRTYEVFDEIKSVPSDDGSGFALDIGVYREYDSGLTVGASGRQEVELPLIINVSARYRLRDWMDVYLTYKNLSSDSGSSNTGSDGSMFFLGMEYLMKSDYSARAGYISQSAMDDYTDQSGTLGVSYTTPSYLASLAASTYNDTHGDYVAFSGSYKPETEAEWKTALFEKETGEEQAAGEELELKEDAGDEKKVETVEYEEPLPPVETEKEEPEKDNESELPARDEISSSRDETESRPAPEKPPEKLTKVANFEIDPRVIIVPSASILPEDEYSNNWAADYFSSLSEDGFFSTPGSASLAPEEEVPREEFYRLLFVTQILELFKTPIAITFNTPYPVSAELWLESPVLAGPVLLQEGTYERAGLKRLVVNTQLIEEKEISAGKYKVRLRLKAKELLPVALEGYITVLDTSLDLSEIAKLPDDKKSEQIENLKKNLGRLGLKVDYLDGLKKSGPITRIEALDALFAASSVNLPTEIDEEGLFKDLDSLSDQQKAAVFIASRGMGSLGGRALMGGYSDNTFKPEKDMTFAEAVALVQRSRELTPADFTPPYRVAEVPEQREYQQVGYQELEERTPETTGEQQAAQAQPGETRYLVVAGSFLMEQNAFAAVNILLDKGYTPEMYVEQVGSNSIHHVSLGRYSTYRDAKAAMQKIPAIPEFDFTVVPVMTGEQFAFAAEQQKKPRKSPPPQQTTRDRSMDQAEGELPLRGTSFLPWNLIRNLEDFDPHGPDVNQPEKTYVY